MKARSLMTWAQAGLAIAVAVSLGIIVGANRVLAHHPQELGLMLRFCATWTMALLAFTGFPRSRRNDLSLHIIGFAALAEIARGVVTHDFSLFAVIAEAAGVMAVHLPAHVEALRCLMRENPSARAFRKRRKDRRAAVIAFTLIAGVVFATLGPQHLRPHLGDPQLERFGAFFVTAMMFVIAFPKRPVLVAVLALATAVSLELGQTIVPGRDAGLPDAVAKALGGLMGVMFGALLTQIWTRRQPRARVAA